MRERESDFGKICCEDYYDVGEFAAYCFVAPCWHVLVHDGQRQLLSRSISPVSLSSLVRSGLHYNRARVLSTILFGSCSLFVHPSCVFSLCVCRNSLPSSLP